MEKDKKTFNRNLNFFDTADLFHDPVLAADSNGEIVYANKSAARLFGFPINSILSKNINLLLPDFNKDVLRTLKKNNKIEFNGRARSNATVYLEITYCGYEKKGKSFSIFILRDVSRQKRIFSERDKLKNKTSEYSTRLENILKDAEVLLVTSGVREKRFRDLIENVPIALGRIDASTDNYEFINTEFRRQSGFTKDEFYALSKQEIFEMVHPDDREDLFIKFKNWADNGYKGLLNHTYRLYNKSKELLWLDAYFYADFDAGGKISAVNQVYIDVTKFMKDKAELKMLGDAIKSTTEMITITDLDNKFIYVNKAFEEKYGYSFSEIAGKKASILGSVKNMPDIHDSILIETAKGGWEGELINTRKNGSEFPVLLSTSQIKDGKGIVIGYIGVARDITEIKNAYDKLNQSLVEKEILLKEVYHRVKNNMQVISSLINIQSHTISDTKTLELFKETRNRVRIMQLIHEKLYKSQDLSRIDFSLYIRDLINQLKRAYPLSRNIDVKIDSGGIYLGVDKAIPCGLIINELISNAYKYAFNDLEKGEIYIMMSLLGEDKYCLIVSDNGIGIPGDFDILKTDSLGMVLVTTLTKQLEGTVEIERNQGTKFTIRF